MKLLLDTNVFISLEPTTLGDVEPRTTPAIDLLQKASQAHAEVYLHPIQKTDINRDKNDERRTLRLKLLDKYLPLPAPIVPDAALLATIGNPQPGTNSEIDSHLIAALAGDLVDVLVTDDHGIHKRCARLSRDLAARCLTVLQAVEKLRDELPAEVSPPPAVRKLYAHQLIADDPILASIRADYGAVEFDAWLKKCRLQHRKCWVVQLQGRNTYAGICIINPEDRKLPDAADPTLKICTFKIADDALGFKLGELLLRAVFDHAATNDFATLFVETYPKQSHLIHLFETFGFFHAGEKSDATGQFELRKHLKPHPSITPESAFEFHRSFGPYQVQWDGVSLFFVPIEPKFHAMLFPDLEKQLQLWPGAESYGNTLRKAYLCKAGIGRLQPGDVLLFYKSQSDKKVTAIGVIEETVRTSDADELARFANKRTVFEKGDINAMAKNSALGILFRYVPLLKKSIPLDDFIAAGLANGHPQSITSLPKEANEWIQSRLK